ncbi:MAG: acyloxyacyl hydrolase, partial [Flavobacteriaceae bacterium]
DEEIWGPYGFPTYGIGWYAGFVGDPEVFGNPNALYGFIRFPISKPTRRNEFGIEPQFGLTYDLKPYDPASNPLNDAIGAHMAVYFALNFGWTYKWTRELDLTYGLDFTHFSNGRMYTPNYGLNMFGINLGIRYHYNADQRRLDKGPNPEKILQARYQRSRKTPNKKVEKNQSVNVYLAFGTVQSTLDAGTKTRYGVFSGVLDYQYKFNNMHGATAGFDYMVDNSLVKDNPMDPDKYMIGFHAGYDFMFWQLTFGVHLGGYLSDARGKTSYFSRPHLRYDITDRIYAQIGLKTEGFAADWVEWGFGFRPFKW